MSGIPTSAKSGSRLGAKGIAPAAMGGDNKSAGSRRFPPFGTPGRHGFTPSAIAVVNPAPCEWPTTTAGRSSGALVSPPLRPAAPATTITACFAARMTSRLTLALYGAITSPLFSGASPKRREASRIGIDEKRGILWTGETGGLEHARREFSLLIPTAQVEGSVRESACESGHSHESVGLSRNVREILEILYPNLGWREASVKVDRDSADVSSVAVCGARCRDTNYASRAVGEVRVDEVIECHALALDAALPVVARPGKVAAEDGGGKAN